MWLVPYTPLARKRMDDRGNFTCGLGQGHRPGADNSPLRVVVRQPERALISVTNCLSVARSAAQPAQKRSRPPRRAAKNASQMTAPSPEPPASARPKRASEPNQRFPGQGEPAEGPSQKGPARHTHTEDPRVRASASPHRAQCVRCSPGVARIVLTRAPSAAPVAPSVATTTYFARRAPGHAAPPVPTHMSVRKGMHTTPPASAAARRPHFTQCVAKRPSRSPLAYAWRSVITNESRSAGAPA